jgi:hypothetical protein
VPTSLFGSVTDARTQLELRAVVNEMAQRIAGDSREWQRLIARQVFTGDGIITPPSAVIAGTEAFPMPANYKRMLVDGNVWRSTSAIQPMLFISSADEWLQRRARGYNHAWGEWMLQGGNMHIWPIMAAHTSSAWQPNHTYNVGDLAVDMDIGTVPYQLVWQVAVKHTSGSTTFANDRLANSSLWVLPAQDIDAVRATFNYIDKNCVTLTSGGFGDAFMADTDSFRLDERLLKLGMIWQWKALKGSPYAEDMATFMDALTRAEGADKPAPILIDRLPSSVMTAYPYPTPSTSNWGWPLS